MRKGGAHSNSYYGVLQSSLFKDRVRTLVGGRHITNHRPTDDDRNGVDENFVKVANPDAPSLVCLDKDTGLLMVDRFMNVAMSYPANYGYVPKTLAGDGDPVDVLVLTPHPVVAGSISAGASRTPGTDPLLDPRSGERVGDLFCGLGNFTLPLAREVRGPSGEQLIEIGGDEVPVTVKAMGARERSLEELQAAIDGGIGSFFRITSPCM